MTGILLAIASIAPSDSSAPIADMKGAEADAPRPSLEFGGGWGGTVTYRRRTPGGTAKRRWKQTRRTR